MAYRLVNQGANRCGLFKFNAFAHVYTEPEQYRRYRYTGPLRFWPVLLVEEQYGISAQTVLRVAEVAPIINHSIITWLIVDTTTATHKTAWALELHACFTLVTITTHINFLPFLRQLRPLKKWGCTALFPVPSSARMIYISGKGYSPNNHEVCLTYM